MRQVHQAVLKNGRRVVVKVQHPYIARLMPIDFVNLERIMSWLAWFDSDFDFGPVLREWTKESIKELDFVHEARNMERYARRHLVAPLWLSMLRSVARNMRSAGIDVVLAAPVVGMVSKRVLTMTFCDGFKITDLGELDRLGIDRLSLLK